MLLKRKLRTIHSVHVVTDNGNVEAMSLYTIYTQHTAMWVRKAKDDIHDTYISYKTQFMESIIYVYLCKNYIYLHIIRSINYSTTEQQQ